MYEPKEKDAFKVDLNDIGLGPDKVQDFDAPIKQDQFAEKEKQLPTFNVIKLSSHKEK